MTRAWHITLSATARDPLFPSEALRREAVRALARVTGRCAVLFCVVDDHVHHVALAERSRVGSLAGGLHRALAPIAGTPLQPAHIRPVEGRSHMRWLVDYILDQPRKHDIGRHPALWTGSCFADLIGARYIPELVLQVGEALPRFRLREAYECVGLAPKPLTPAPIDLIRAMGAAHLVAAAAAAFSAGPRLVGKAAETMRAKRAAVQVAEAAGIPLTEIAWAMEQPLRSVRRLRGPALPSTHTEAVRRRVALESVVLSAPRDLRPPARG